MHFVCVVYFGYLCSLQPHYFSNYTLIYSFPCRCLWTVDRDRKPSRINITSSCIRNSNQKNFFYYSSLTSQEETKGFCFSLYRWMSIQCQKSQVPKEKVFSFCWYKVRRTRTSNDKCNPMHFNYKNLLQGKVTMTKLKFPPVRGTIPHLLWLRI